MCKQIPAPPHTLPPGDIATSRKPQKRSAPWNCNSSKFISAPILILGRRAQTMYHCVPPRKPEFEPFLVK